MASRKRAATGDGQHERMSAVDTAWLRMDGPANTMMIVSVIATATPVRTADLRRVLKTRLLCFPRFRKRVETDPFGASWIEDSNFDLDAHLVVTELPGKDGRRELQALAAKLASQRFDPARPLWQLHFVEHYGTGSAWVLRLHHCYADGIAMIRVLLSLTEQDAGPALAGAQAAESRPGRRGRRKSAADPLQLLDWVAQLTNPPATSSKTPWPRVRDCSRRACTSFFIRRSPRRSRSRRAAWSANLRGSSRCPTTLRHPCARP